MDRDAQIRLIQTAPERHAANAQARLACQETKAAIRANAASMREAKAAASDRA